MNSEKIDMLYQEAFDAVRGEMKEKDPARCYSDGWPDLEQIRMKFAELIVRDCEQALRPQLRDMISRGQAYELIKQHFGVKR